MGIVLALPLAFFDYRSTSGEPPFSLHLIAEPRSMPAGVIQAIQAAVEPQIALVAVRDHRKQREQAWTEMRSFYERRHFRPAWFTPESSRPQARELITAIDTMAGEGLDPRSYQRDTLGAALRQIESHPDLSDVQSQSRLAQADLSLTYTYFTMAAHLARGRLQPETLDIDWHDKPVPVDLGSPLEAAMKDGGSIRTALRSYAPASPDYDRLRDALAHYEDLAAHGGWPVVGLLLRKGAQGEKVTHLRARLAAEGDLPAAAETVTSPATDTYDDSVAEGVARFQRRHGLDPTGKVDKVTLAELDLPVQERIRQIEVNLERRRWLPADFGPRYIAVNIPDFRMKLVEDGRTSLEMRVIVGKPLHNQTPVFSGRMTYLVLNPAWNIPDDIVTKEIGPAMAKDSSYLERKSIEVVRGWGKDIETVDPSSVDFAKLGSKYRLRARPGAANPLGQVKFIFPNQFDVYLHDTPADHLFNASSRAFSHGCIRLEKPLDLVNALLEGDPKWTPDAVQTALDEGDPRVVSLPHPLPIHILYFTTWVDADGTLQFRRDVYSQDAKVAAGLARESLLSFDFNPARGQVKATL